MSYFNSDDYFKYKVSRAMTLKSMFTFIAKIKMSVKLIETRDLRFRTS